MIKNETPEFSKEEHTRQRTERYRQEQIKHGTRLDIKKEIPEGTGQINVQNLLQAINDKNEVEKIKILKQIGSDLQIIMKDPSLPSIEDIGGGEYKILCLTGTAGQRGILRIEGNNVKLNFPDLADTQFGSRPTMKKAVELYFGLAENKDNSFSINVGQIE